MEMPPTDAAMFLDMRDDDSREKAWADFQARYRNVILSWCKRRFMAQVDAEDLTQEVLLKLFQKLAAYDPAKGRFRVWLKAVVNNALTDWGRRQERRLEHGGIGGTDFLDQLAQVKTSESADELSGVVEDQASAIAAEVIEKVKARVEPKTWQAFYRTAVEQRPPAEVAAALGLAVGAVHGYRSRVKKMLIQEYSNVNTES